MKPWQLTYQVMQTIIEIPATPAATRPVVVKPCGALAPDSGLRICHYPFPANGNKGRESVCQRLYGHPGGHSKKPTTCNRPAGHEGPHTFIVSRDAQRLGEW